MLKKLRLYEMQYNKGDIKVIKYYNKLESEYEYRQAQQLKQRDISSYFQPL